MSRKPAAAFALAALLVACQSTLPNSSAPGTGAPGTAAPASGEPGASGDAADATALPGFVSGPGDVYLLDPTEGLAALPSYKATLTVTFAGTRDGASSSWTSTTTYLFVRQPQASLLTIEQPADLPVILPAWSAEADGAIYVRSEDGHCSASAPELGEAPDPSADPQGAPVGPLSRDPAARLPGFVGAEASVTETVNTVPSEVATFGPSALGLPAEATVDGRVAIAINGGYVVQYALTIEGGAEQFGEGVSGRMERRYELTDIGTTAIAIPAGCPAGMLQATMPADATDVESLPGLLALTTTASVADTAALYRDTSLVSGWTAVGDPMVTNELATLHFTAPGLKITVAITQSAGGSRVEIVGTRT